MFWREKPKGKEEVFYKINTTFLKNLETPTIDKFIGVRTKDSGGYVARKVLNSDSYCNHRSDYSFANEGITYFTTLEAAKEAISKEIDGFIAKFEDIRQKVLTAEPEDYTK
jgi:hypothetical protein